MGDGDQPAAAPQLPTGAPADLQQFFDCTSPTATIKNGPLTWISVRPRDLIPADGQTFLPDVILDHVVQPTLTITPDPSGPGKATLKIGVSLGEFGTLGPSLPVSIADGQLSLDTSSLPQPLKEPVDRAVKNLNDWFKKNGNGFGAPAFGSGEVSLSKVPLAVSDGTSTVINQPMTDGGAITPADNLPTLGGSGQGATKPADKPPTDKRSVQPRTPLTPAGRQRIEDLRKARDKAEDDVTTNVTKWREDRALGDRERLKAAQKALEDACSDAGVPVPAYGEAFPVVDPEYNPPPTLPPIEPYAPPRAHLDQAMAVPVDNAGGQWQTAGVDGPTTNAELTPPDLVPDIRSTPEPLNLTPDDAGVKAAADSRQAKVDIDNLLYKRMLDEEEREDQELFTQVSAESLARRYKVPLILALAVVMFVGVGVALVLAFGFAPSTALVANSTPTATAVAGATPTQAAVASATATPLPSTAPTSTGTANAVPTASQSVAPATSPPVAPANEITITGPLTGMYAALPDCFLGSNVVNVQYPGSVAGQNVVLQMSIRPFHGPAAYPLGGSSTAATYNFMTLATGLGAGSPSVFGGTNGSIVVTAGAGASTISATADLVSTKDGSTEHVVATNLTCK